MISGSGAGSRIVDSGTARRRVFIYRTAVRLLVRDRLTSDIGVYALSGVFSLVVFAVALVVLSAILPGGLGDSQLVGLVVGYLLFVGVYAVAWFMYTEIDAREEV